MNMTNTTQEEIEAQARRIVELGKLLHDYVHKNFIQHVVGSRGRKKLVSLTLPQLDAVRAAGRSEEMTITELSRMLGVSAPSASAMVDRLVERGILIRERSRQDRRKVVVRVSEDVAEDIEQIEQTILGEFVDIIEKIGPASARKWCEALEQVKRILDEKTSCPDRRGPSNQR